MEKNEIALLVAAEPAPNCQFEIDYLAHYVDENDVVQGDDLNHHD